MADDPGAARDIIDDDWADDPIVRGQQVDALMAGPPADLPSIIVLGDDAVFGIRPIRRKAWNHSHAGPVNKGQENGKEKEKGGVGNARPAPPQWITTRKSLCKRHSAGTPSGTDMVALSTAGARLNANRKAATIA